MTSCTQPASRHGEFNAWALTIWSCDRQITKDSTTVWTGSAGALPPARARAFTVLTEPFPSGPSAETALVCVTLSGGTVAPREFANDGVSV